MNKSILKSETPKRCEQIANGKCTILLSKTMPKLKPPFKSYIYETKGLCDTPTFIDEDGHISYRGRSAVIGECVVDNVYEYSYLKITTYNEDCLGLEKTRYRYLIGADEKKAMCLSDEEVKDYGKGKTLYGLHISQVKIYDKPKELGEFRGLYRCYGRPHNCPKCQKII